MFVYIRSIFRTFFISTLVGESKTQQGLFIVYYINKINIYFRSEIVTKIFIVCKSWKHSTPTCLQLIVNIDPPEMVMAYLILIFLIGLLKARWWITLMFSFVTFADQGQPLPYRVSSIFNSHKGNCNNLL